MIQFNLGYFCYDCICADMCCADVLVLCFGLIIFPTFQCIHWQYVSVNWLLIELFVLLMYLTCYLILLHSKNYALCLFCWLHMWNYWVFFTWTGVTKHIEQPLPLVHKGRGIGGLEHGGDYSDGIEPVTADSEVSCMMAELSVASVVHYFLSKLLPRP